MSRTRSLAPASKASYQLSTTASPYVILARIIITTIIIHCCSFRESTFTIVLVPGDGADSHPPLWPMCSTRYPQLVAYIKLGKQTNCNIPWKDCRGDSIMHVDKDHRKRHPILAVLLGPYANAKSNFTLFICINSNM